MESAEEIRRYHTEDQDFTRAEPEERIRIRTEGVLWVGQGVTIFGKRLQCALFLTLRNFATF